jgi:hypothetical protein
MCKGSGCNLDRNFETLSPALRPEAPDHPDGEAFESTDGLSFGLALSDASIEIRASLGRVMRLGQGDAVNDRVEAPVSKPVEAMTNVASGRRFEGRNAGVCGDLRISSEARTRPQNPRQRTGCEDIDPRTIGSEVRSRSAVSSSALNRRECRCFLAHDLDERLHMLL